MPRRHASLSVIVAGAGTATIIAVALCAWPFTVDDAYIVAGYARQLHEHDQYSLDGTGRSDGVTGPLWLVPFLVAHALGASPLVFAKAVGLSCTAAAVMLVLLSLRRRQGSRWLVPIAALLCASQSDLVIWSVGGLETGAATLLTVLSGLAVASQRMRREHHGLLGVSVALLAWLRPETALFAAVLLLAAWLRDRRGGLIAAALAVCGLLSVIGFRWLLFGHAWPLSASAKPAELGHGVHYVLTAMPLLTGLFGVPLFAHGMRAGRATDRWIGAAVLAHCLAVTLAGGDWMPGFRLFVPILPLYAWVTAVGAVRIRRRWLGVALAGASCVLPLMSLAVQVPEARASADDRERAGAALARWLEAHACRVALVDVGYLVYASRVHAVDLAGITDESFAQLPGGHVNKDIAVGHLLERRPDTVVLRGKKVRSIDHGLPLDAEWHSGTERRLAHSAAITKRYQVVKVVRYAAGYVYYVLQADGAQRCSSR